MYRVNGLRIGLVALLSLGLGACSIARIEHYPLKQPSAVRSGEVLTGDSVTGKDFSDHVGWGTLTVFSIPVVPIFVNGQPAQDLMKSVQDALIQAGYTPRIVNNGAKADGPVLMCEVKDFKFRNYTWFAPLIPTWGRVSLVAKLTAQDGTVLWKHTFTGKGGTLNFIDGYNIAARKSMTRLLNDMVVAFTNDAFVKALAGQAESTTVNQKPQEKPAATKN